MFLLLYSEMHQVHRKLANLRRNSRMSNAYSAKTITQPITKYSSKYDIAWSTTKNKRVFPHAKK